jgi:hypothetical protein
MSVLRRSTELAVVLAALTLLAGLRAEEPKAPPPVLYTTLDITKPLEGLPVAIPTSSPEEVSAAIQSRLDHLFLRNMAGRVAIPEGRWPISRPLFMNGDNKELVGAGVGRTVLEAADGFRGMPMVNTSTRTHFPERPLQACNRPLLTDPKARVLDESVQGERFGLRTYAEFPATSFPATTHIALGGKGLKAWAKDIEYKADDVVTVNSPPMGDQAQVVCVQAHRSAPETEPLRGKEWQRFWIIKIPFGLQFFADPFAAGAYDTAARRAGNWATMREFTLDFAFVLNSDPKLFGDGRELCAVERCWALTMASDGRLTLRLAQEGNRWLHFTVATACTQTGTYRLALQVDFARQAVRAWVRKPGEDRFTRTLEDTKTLPPDGRFRKTEYSFFTIPASEGGPSAANRHYPPVDITVAGLHMAAGLRYADGADLAARDTGKPTDDAFRYFASDAATMAFLPLAENPPVEGSHTQALLVTVQHGPASGDAGQKGYGYFRSPAQIHGVGRPRVSDMTLRPGPTWGVGIVNWNTLDAVLRDLDIRGGFYAVGDLFLGAQYTFDVRDCVFSGSEAGWCGMSNIVYFRNVTFGPVGRYGVLLSGSNSMMDGVRFVDPETHRSEYYYRHIGTVMYGGMNLLTNISAEGPRDSRYPSIAAFSQSFIPQSRTSFTLRACRIANLPPEAVFLELPACSRPTPGVLLMEDFACEGKPIAALVRTESPWWNGEVRGFDARSFAKWLDYRPAPETPTFRAAANYRKGDAVLVDGQAYRCLQDHAAKDDLRPGAEAAKAYWQAAVPRIVFVAK